MVLLTLVAATASTAHARTKSVSWLGAMADGPVVDRQTEKYVPEWRRIHQAGFGFARVTFPWNAVQPASQAGPNDWFVPDDLVRKATTAGLQVLPVVVGAPGWAQVQPGLIGSAPADPGTFAAFMTQLVQRYGPDGEFWKANPDLPKRPLREWQLWNEPNIPYYWAEPGWVEGYAQLLRRGHDAVKAADPGAKVVMAGLTNASYDDLAKLYAVGARGSFDAFAIHPYTRTAEGVIEIARRVRKTMDAAGDKKVPLWLTEMAWAQEPKPTRPWSFKSPQKRARVTRRAIQLVARNRKRLNIGRVALYTWASKGGVDDWPSYAGLRQVKRGKLRDTATLKALRPVIAKLAR